MRFLIPTLLILAIDLYVFQAIVLLAQNWSKNQKTILYIIYWLFPIGALITGMLAVNGILYQLPRAPMTIWRAILFIAYFSKFIAMFPMWIDDIRRLFNWAGNHINPNENFDPSRSSFLSKMAILVSGVPFGLLSYGVFRNPYRYRIHNIDLPIVGLNPDLIGYKIVQISDIHSGSFFLKEPVKNSVQMINGLNPDIVVFTGDLVNSKTNEVEEYLDVFDKIISKQGVFSTTGNHDYGDYSEWPDEDAKKKNFQDLKDAHKKMGWDLLMNEHRIIDVKGAKIGLLGVENYSAIARFPRYGKLDQAYANLPKTDVNILLSHDPSHWDFQIRPEYPDIDLTLSGHTHGFQFGIEIPGWFRWSPSQYMYKQWAGLYQEGKQFLYVNRGLGFLGYPGRVGILPEITCITLKSA